VFVLQGGLGGEPGNEAHGGYTYCGLAALALLGELNVLDISRLEAWMAQRQTPIEGGFNGRTNKLTDGCYSFWVGAAFALLGKRQTANENEKSNLQKSATGESAPRSGSEAHENCGLGGHNGADGGHDVDSTRGEVPMHVPVHVPAVTSMPQHVGGFCLSQKSGIQSTGVQLCIHAVCETHVASSDLLKFR
jgi:hypothetical protein